MNQLHQNKGAIDGCNGAVSGQPSAHKRKRDSSGLAGSVKLSLPDKKLKIEPLPHKITAIDAIRHFKEAPGAFKNICAELEILWAKKLNYTQKHLPSDGIRFRCFSTKGEINLSSAGAERNESFLEAVQILYGNMFSALIHFSRNTYLQNKSDFPKILSISIGSELEHRIVYSGHSRSDGEGLASFKVWSQFNLFRKIETTAQDYFRQRVAAMHAACSALSHRVVCLIAIRSKNNCYILSYFSAKMYVGVCTYHLYFICRCFTTGSPTNFILANKLLQFE